MADDRGAVLDRAFLAELAKLEPGPPRQPTGPVAVGSELTVADALALFDAQAGSRHLDLAMRRMRADGVGYYTIGSSGHEGNAAVAAALRPTDPALLHYRSGAFYLARAAQVGGIDARLDVLMGAAGSRDEPMAGGRHKVFGRPELAISPQTSTIASHLPRAVGMAFAIEHGKKLRVDARPTPPDAVVCCTFGDASINHSTAQGALNAAAHGAHRGLRLPLLFVCEDNGLGISVPTPDGWIAKQRDLPRFEADGCDLVDAYRAAVEAVSFVRERRRPALLHLRVVRLLGHAGSDVELAYRTAGQIREAEVRDPVLATARLLIGAGVSASEVLTRYERQRELVRVGAMDAASREPLRDAADILAPLAPPRPAAVAREAERVAAPEARAAILGGARPEDEGPMSMAAQIRWALAELLAKYPQMLLFGEDVARKGGVYGVTRGLSTAAGPARVFDTLLDEQTILGLALGCAQQGLLPCPEIQYLAYLHNAEDQLRGEAATLRFFSQGAYGNPMVVRVAAFAYQRGFGGHFHNDHSIAVLRDIPGLVVAVPSRGDDAAAMLHTCFAAARSEGTVSVFLEPIALYHRRDLYAEGDGLLCDTHRQAPEHAPIGRARVHGDGADLLLVSFANGVPMCLAASRALAAEGVAARVLDLRWVSPLPVEDLLEHARACGRVLIADETRASGGVSEGVITALVDGGFAGSIRRVTSRDCFVPLGPAAHHVLLSEADVLGAARGMLGVR